MADQNIPVPPQEFIERDRQRPPDTRQITPDMAIAGRQGEAARRAPPGEPPLDYNVRSVYDSRPINGTDFNIAVAFQGSTTDTFTDALCEFIVPPGSICVLLQTHTWVEANDGSGGPGPAFARSQVLASLTLDGGNVPYNQNVPVGSEQDDLLKSFIIANEFQAMGVRLIASIGTPFPVNAIVYAHFYGNLLAKTGRPTPFEIANPAGSGAPARVAPYVPPPLPSVRVQPPQIPVAVAPAAPPRAKLAVPYVPRKRAMFAAKPGG